MRFEAQIQASRVNGAKSHGPATETGKERSSQNAVKHALSARSVVLCNEDRPLFDQLEQDYIDSLQPCTVLESHVVQHIAVAEWRLHRAFAVGTAIADQSILQNKLQDDQENPKLAPDEPCIILADYPKPEEDEFGEPLPPIPKPFIK